MTLIIANSTAEQRLSSTIALDILYCSGMLSCGLVLFLTFYARLHRTRVNLLLVNVTLADFLLCMSNLIMQTPNVISEQKWFACDVSGYITYVTGLEASWFVPAVVMNRYLSLYHQELFKKVYTTRNIVWMILAGWSVPIVFITPFYVYGHTGFEYAYLNCGVNTEGAGLTWTLLVYALIVGPTFATVGVTAYCNLRIFFKLRQHAKTTNIKKGVMAQNRQLMYVTLLHTAYNVCLQSPYILGKLFPVIVEGNSLRQIFPLIYIFNGTISPLTTLYVVRPYRYAALNLFCRGKNNVVEPGTSTMAGDPVIRGKLSVRRGAFLVDGVSKSTRIGDMAVGHQ